MIAIASEVEKVAKIVQLRKREVCEADKECLQVERTRNPRVRKR